MKKFAWLVGLAAVAGLAAGLFAGAGVASAEEPGPGPDGPLAAEFQRHPWLVEAVILAAAQTIGIPPAEVKEALRHGADLQGIGMRHGVRPEVLAHGVVRHLHDILGDLVSNGRISPEEARRAQHFVEEHIWRILNHHFVAV